MIAMLLAVTLSPEALPSWRASETFSGQYSCSQGATDLKLEFSDGRREGRFVFRRGRDGGSYFFIVRPQADGSLRLEPTRWDRRVPNYSMVPAVVHISAAGSVSGRIDDPTCGSLKAWVDADSPLQGRPAPKSPGAFVYDPTLGDDPRRRYRPVVEPASQDVTDPSQAPLPTPGNPVFYEILNGGLSYLDRRIGLSFNECQMATVSKQLSETPREEDYKKLIAGQGYACGTTDQMYSGITVPYDQFVDLARTGNLYDSKGQRVRIPTPIRFVRLYSNVEFGKVFERGKRASAVLAAPREQLASGSGTPTPASLDQRIGAAYAQAYVRAPANGFARSTGATVARGNEVITDLGLARTVYRFLVQNAACGALKGKSRCTYRLGVEVEVSFFQMKMPAYKSDWRAVDTVFEVTGGALRSAAIDRQMAQVASDQLKNAGSSSPGSSTDRAAQCRADAMMRYDWGDTSGAAAKSMFCG